MNIPVADDDLSFNAAGHFPCKAISKIVQLPTEAG